MGLRPDPGRLMTTLAEIARVERIKRLHPSWPQADAEQHATDQADEYAADEQAEATQ